jgi:hypothetical protein
MGRGNGLNLLKPLHLVVVDDSDRFAFHVWRYLGREIGVGPRNGSGAQAQVATKVSAKDEHSEDLGCRGFFWKSGKPEGLPTANGLVTVWWVPGDQKIKETFPKVQDELKGEAVFFLVDMRGESGEPGNVLGEDGELLGKTAVELILADHSTHGKRGQPDIMLVSSYETGNPPHIGKDNGSWRIFPKSPDTLERLARSILSRLKQPVHQRPCVSTVHVLVTGAGFEIRDDFGGFGLPETHDLLLEMGAPFQQADFRLEKGHALPILVASRSPRENVAMRSKLNAIAGEGNLDAWWSFLLEEELLRLVPSTEASVEERPSMKMEATLNEQNFREAFRRVVLKYDWGHLSQSLSAASLDWCSWLTTNYTRFADRAISLFELDQERSGQGLALKSWKIVSTSIEAVSLSREVLYAKHRTRNLKPQNSNDFRYLFKLHGDIAHLRTMAIAGYDKEMYGPLSVLVDSLHQVYGVAEAYLQQELEARERPRLVWHIVGHGLRDWLLLNLIKQVCFYAKDRRIPVDIIVVDHAPEGPVQRLLSCLGNLEDRVWQLQKSAAAYMACIQQNGGLPEFTRKGLGPWAEQLNLENVKDKKKA